MDGLLDFLDRLDQVAVVVCVAYAGLHFERAFELAFEITFEFAFAGELSLSASRFILRRTPPEAAVEKVKGVR